MNVHRFSDYFEQARVPQLPLQEPTPEGFMILPNVLVLGLNPTQLFWQNALYQIAFERAQAESRPSLPERDLLGVWN